MNLIKKTLLTVGITSSVMSAYAVPNINTCTRMIINNQAELLSTGTQAAYERSLSVILSDLRPALAANIVNNPANVCHILQIRTDTAPNDAISMYIDQMEAYLYAVTVTRNGVTQYYGDPTFLAPIPNNSKWTFNIEYPSYSENFLYARSAQKLGNEMLNKNNGIDRAKNIFFNAATIIEASKMPSIEVAMTDVNMWNKSGSPTMLQAKKNYLQQYKCSRWQTINGQISPDAKYVYLTNNYNNLNDGIKAAYDLTDWYAKAGTSASNRMSYITPVYAPQGSRNKDGELGAHPCTK